MDLNKYWNDVRAKMAELGRQQVYYLISLDNPEKGITAGRVMDLSDCKQAARRLVERTHALATPEQIAEHLAAQQRQVEQLAEAEQARKSQLAMPKELQDLVRLATQSVIPKDTAPGAAPAPVQGKKEK